MMSPKPDLHAYTTSVEYILASIMHITFVGKGRWDPGGRLTNKQTNILKMTSWYGYSDWYKQVLLYICAVSCCTSLSYTRVMHVWVCIAN